MRIKSESIRLTVLWTVRLAAGLVIGFCLWDLVSTSLEIESDPHGIFWLGSIISLAVMLLAIAVLLLTVKNRWSRAVAIIVFLVAGFVFSWLFFGRNGGCH